nr:hypothetical protein [Tanacetum cinerariifolium]
MARLQFYDYHNMVTILEKGEFNTDFHLMVDFIAASPLRTMSEASLRRNLKLRDEDGIVSIPDTELFENLTLMGIVPLFDTMLIKQGEGLGTPTEPHHTPSPESSALPTVADESASPIRDGSQGEACPTDSGFIADQDRATIVKSST